MLGVQALGRQRECQTERRFPKALTPSMVNTDATDLDRQFAIDSTVRVFDAAASYPIIEVTNAHSTASIALHGGQVLAFQPRGQDPVLWLSKDAIYREGKSVRGGIPVCWPWFGVHPDPALPAHGFVRNRFWQLTSTAQLDDGGTEVVLFTEDDEQSHALWPYSFQLQLRVRIGTTLSLALTMINTSTERVQITTALHSYFDVADIGKTTVAGLDSVEYIDTLQNHRRIRQHGLIRFDAELDRIYQQTQGIERVQDALRQRTIRLQKQRSESTVVWNPWIDKSARMTDFEKEGHRRMLCVETAKVGADLISLEAGESYTFGVDMSLETLCPTV